MPDATTKAKKRLADRKIKEQSIIKVKLLKAGLTLVSIAQKYNLPDASVRNALREPNIKAERAIAAALGTRPEDLWRTRYHASGQRRSPQDYDRVPTMAQRRNEQAA